MPNTHRFIGRELKAAGKIEEKNLPVEEEKFDPTQPRLNLIFLGTNHHRSKPGAQGILTELADHAISDEHQFVHMIDGPGGEPSSEISKKHPMLGCYDFSCQFVDGKLQTEKTRRNSRLDRPLPVAGLVSGKGYKDAINEAMQVVETLIQGKKITSQNPLVINAFGYSRGADTALRVANALQARFGKDLIQMNIFAIDPVPGTGRRKAMKGRIIPEIVGEYHAILMAHENKPGFEPQDKSRILIQNPERTVVTHQLYGGKHGSGIRIKSEFKKDPVAGGTALLALDDLHKFSERHGTRLTSTIPHLQRIKKKPDERKDSRILTHPQRLTVYTRLKALPNARGTRDFIQNKMEYVLHGANYFMNKEHQELFKKNFPHYFDYFFQRNIEKAALQAVRDDIAKIQKDEELALTLKQAKYPLPLSEKNFPPTSGIPLIVRYEVLEHQPVVTDELSRLIYSVNTAANNIIRSSGMSSNAIEVARQLLAEVQNVLTSYSSDVAVADFESLCKAKIKAAVYHAVKELDEANYQGKFRYQLDDVLQNNPHTKLIHDCLYDKKISNDREVKSDVNRIAVFVEKTVSDDKLSTRDKNKEIITTLQSLEQANQRTTATPARKNLQNYLVKYTKNFASIGQEFKQDRLSYRHYMNEKLKNYVSSPKQWFGGDLTKARIALAKLITLVLDELHNKKIANEVSVMKEIVDTALTAASDLRLQHGKNNEGDIDKLLRSFQGNLVTFRHESIKEKSEGDKILKKFKEGVEGISKQFRAEEKEVKVKTHRMR